MNRLSPLPFERLALVDDPTPRDAALNMALDEFLLERLDGNPLLRIYRWKRRTVSIGYFEKFGSASQRWPKHDFVRRWTGGGIVEHGDDLTFSLLVPRSFPLATVHADESYRAIHAAVAVALSRGGVFSETVQSTATTPSGVDSHACFERPVRHDLLLAGRKIAGGAQRRTRHGLLHQGSIQFASLSGLADGLPAAFGESVLARTLSADELHAATVLVDAKYGTLAWQRRF